MFCFDSITHNSLLFLDHILFLISPPFSSFFMISHKNMTNKLDTQHDDDSCSGLSHSRKKLQDQVYSSKSAVSQLSPEKLKKVKGVIIKSEWGQRVSPLANYPVQEIAEASMVLLLQHNDSISESKVVEQVCLTFKNDLRQNLVNFITEILDPLANIFPVFYDRGRSWNSCR